MIRRRSRLGTVLVTCAAVTMICRAAVAQDQKQPTGGVVQESGPADTSAALDKAAAAAVRPIPSDLAKEVERASMLGYELYLNDWASAAGTDVLVEKVGDLRGKVGGYLTFREGTGAGPTPSYRVWFFTLDDPPRVAYTIRVPLQPGTDGGQSRGRRSSSSAAWTTRRRSEGGAYVRDLRRARREVGPVADRLSEGANHVASLSSAPAAR